jgi:DNA-binding beta-propeller fold protein YncE
MSARRTTVLVAVVLTGLTLAGGPGAAPPRTVVIHVTAYSFPDAVGAGFGSLWISAHRGDAATRVDPRTNRTVAHVRLGDTQCWSFAFGARHAWASNCEGETGVARTYEIDPRTNRVIKIIRGADAVFAGGSLWLTTFPAQSLIRLDPVTHVVLARIRAPFAPNDSGDGTGTGAFGALWTSNGIDTAARIDLRTNTVRVIPLPGAKPPDPGGYFDAANPLALDGRVWLTNAAGIFEIDPRTTTVRLHRIRIGPFSQQGDVGFAAYRHDLFVRVSDTTVDRIDTRTFQVIKRYSATGGGGKLTIAFGSLWVANAAADTVWREPL